MEPTAPNSANTNYEGLELIVEWLKAHSDSRNDIDRFEGTPPALNDTGHAGPHVADWPQASSDGHDKLMNEISPDAGTEVTINAPVVAHWRQVFSDSRNEDHELANPIAAADSAASPRQLRRLNDRFICTHEGCDQTFKSTTTLYRHEGKHKAAAFHCEQCNYSTWRKDKLQSHIKKHNHYTDLSNKDDLPKHQEKHECRHDEEKQTSFQCEECNYSTWRKDMLKSHHDRRHKQLEYMDRLKCQKCDYETYHKADLRAHQRRHVEEATDMDRLECQKCDYETYHKGDFRAHQRRHVKEATNTRQ